MYVNGTASGVPVTSVADLLNAARGIVAFGKIKRARRLSTSSKRKKDRRVRSSLWRSQKSLCKWCEQPVPKDEATLDHVIPLSRGGSNGTDNVVMACQACNKQRKNHVHVHELAKTKPTSRQKEDSK